LPEIGLSGTIPNTPILRREKKNPENRQRFFKKNDFSLLTDLRTRDKSLLTDPYLSLFALIFGCFVPNLRLSEWFYIVAKPKKGVSFRKNPYKRG
jgi:hypothetical protein